MTARTICQVIDYGGPTGGSFIPALESLSKAVVQRGERFVVIASYVPGSTWPSELTEAGAELFVVRNEKEVIARLRQVRPSIVHSHFTRFDLAALRGHSGARVFWHVHSHRENRSTTVRVKAFVKYRIVGRSVEALVAVSNSLAAECVAFCAPPDKVRVVQNGIDTQRFRPPSDAERIAARRGFGIEPHDHVVLFFERVPYKGGETLREALRQMSNVRLLVAGGTQADRDRFGTLPQVISINRAADARELYWAADVLAFASDDEAFGFVLAEALACGLPVAASNIPIVHEICGDTDQVQMFPVRDAARLAIALQRFGERKNWNGRKRIVDHFNLGRWTADMLRLYD